MKKIFFLFIISILLSNCCNFNAKLYNNRGVFTLPDYDKIKVTYDNSINFFGKDLTKHFPNFNSGDCYLFLTNNADTNSLFYIYLIMFYSDEQFEEIEHFAKNNSIQKYHFTDSCLMLTNYNANLKIFNKYNFKNCENLSSSMLPITNFEFCKNNPIITKKFFKKATIYLLGAERGKFLPDYKLTNKGVGLPDGWEHGYTRGMAIWCNTVVYWLEVW